MDMHNNVGYLFDEATGKPGHLHTKRPYMQLGRTGGGNSRPGTGTMQVHSGQRSSFNMVNSVVPEVGPEIFTRNALYRFFCAKDQKVKEQEFDNCLSVITNFSPKSNIALRPITGQTTIHPNVKSKKFYAEEMKNLFNLAVQIYPLLKNNLYYEINKMVKDPYDEHEKFLKDFFYERARKYRKLTDPEEKERVECELKDHVSLRTVGLDQEAVIQIFNKFINIFQKIYKNFYTCFLCIYYKCLATNTAS